VPGVQPEPAPDEKPHAEPLASVVAAHSMSAAPTARPPLADADAAAPEARGPRPQAAFPLPESAGSCESDDGLYD